MNGSDVLIPLVGLPFAGLCALVGVFLVVRTQAKEKRLGAAVMLATLTCAVLLGLAVYFVPHCVPADALARIRPGMSKEDVSRLLGPPQMDDIHGHQLLYWKPGRWCSVSVHLDDDDRVQGVLFQGREEASVFHDH